MAGTASIMAGMAFVKITTDNAELIAGLKQAQGKLASFSSSVKSLSRDLATMAMTVGPAMLMSLKTFSDFDDQMRTTKAVTAATATQFKQLSEQAGKLGDETSFTGEQVASGMAALGRMGFNPKEIENAIRPVMDLSRATGTEMAEAAEIAANNMRVFGMEAAEMSTAADLMSATANGSAQTLTDLGEALKMAGPHAKRAGADLKETCAALGILANMGIKGSLAGTALGKSYKRLADPKVMDYLKQFGIKTVDDSGNLRKMRDILVEISKVMAQMGSAKQIEFAENVFDARGSLGGGTLSVNTRAIDEFVKKLDASNGYANKAAKEMDDGIGGTLRRLSSAAEGFSCAMGRMIGEAFAPILEFCSSFILIARDIVNAFPLLTKGFLLVAGVAGVLGAAMFAVGMAGKLIGGTVSNIKALAAALSGSAAVAAQAEKMKQFTAEKGTAARTALENRRHWNELQNAAKEAKFISQTEANKLTAARERYNAEKALNDKKKADFMTAHDGSSKGFKNNPALKDAGKELKQQKLAAAAAQANFEAAKKAGAQAKQTYMETRNAAFAAANAQAEYTAANKTAWGETKRLVAIEAQKRTALMQSAAAQKAAMNFGPLTAEQTKNFAAMTAAAQTSFAAAENAATRAALKICASLGLTGTAADVAAIKILTMNNVAAGQAGWAALTGGLSRARAAIIAFVTASDAWSFSTLKNINFSKIWKTVTLALGNAFSFQAVKMNVATAATAALGIVTKGITAAFVAAKMAVLALWAAMKAHPVAALITVIVALTAAIAALCINIQKYQESQMLDFADKYRARQEKQIAADEIRMKRLQQLAQKQKLSSDEMKTAEELMRNMQRYGDNLGITLDKETSQLNAQAGAWENLAKAMTDKKIGAIDRVITQTEKNIQKLNEEQRRLGKDTFGNWGNLTQNEDGSYARISADELESRSKAISQELDMQNEKLFALKEEQRLLKNPPQTEKEVEKEIQYQEELTKEVEKAQKAQLAAEEKLARLSRTDLENKIHDIEKEREEYKKNIQTQLDYEKGNKDQDKEKIKTLEEKLAGADKTYQIQIDKAKKEQSDEFAKQLNAMREDYRKAQAELEQSRKERAEDKQIDKTAEQSPARAMDMIDKMLLDLASEIDKTKKEVESALQEAAKPGKDGKVTREAQDKVRKSRDSLSKLQQRESSLQQKREGLRDTREKQEKQAKESYGKKISDVEKEQQDKVDEKAIDTQIKSALKTSLQNGIDLINSLINKFAAAADSAKQAYESAYTEAMKDGTLNEDEKKNLDLLFEKYTKASGQKTKYEEKLIEVRGNVQQKTASAFDASALTSLFGADGTARMTSEERIAKATEDTAKYTKETAKNITGSNILIG